MRQHTSHRKKLSVMLLSVILMFCAAGAAHALDAVLCWQKNSETDLIGYNVYYAGMQFTDAAKPDTVDSVDKDHAAQAQLYSQFNINPTTHMIYVLELPDQPMPNGYYIGITAVNTKAVESYLTPLLNTRTDNPADTQPPGKAVLTATASSGLVSLSWNKPADDLGVTRFTLFRDGGSLTEVVAGAQTAYTYEDRAVVPETEYSYAVRAFDAAGHYTDSDPVAVTTPDQPVEIPGAVTGLSGRALSAFSVQLSWQARPAAEKISTYEILRSNGGNQATFQQNSGSSYTDTTARPETTYTYQVRAVNSAGRGPYSTTIQVTTPDENQNDNTPPSVPAGLKATPNAGAPSVQLTWNESTDVGGTVTGYRIYRDNNTTQPVDVVSGATQTRYTDNKVSVNQTYVYQVSAVDSSNNESALCNAVSVTVSDQTNPENLINANTYQRHEGDIRFGSIDNLWDGGTSGNDQDMVAVMGAFAVEFDFGKQHALKNLRLFGDDSATYRCVSFSVLVRDNVNDRYRTVVEDATCNGQQWYEHDLDTTARYLRITFVGSGSGPFTEVRELQVFGAPINGPSNHAPDLKPLSNRTVEVGQNVAFTLEATDPDAGDTLSYAVVGQPPAASFNPLTGAFSWTPTQNDVGAHTMTFTVTDSGTPPMQDSETLTITVTGTTPPDDTTPPTVPGNPNAIYNADSKSVILAWTPSTDTGTGVKGYLVYRVDNGDQPLATVTQTTYTDTTVQSGQSYDYRIRAFDGNNNLSEAAIAVITVPGTPDTTPPTPVENLDVEFSKAPMRVTLFWDPAKDEHGQIAVYRIYRADKGDAPVGQVTELSWRDEDVNYNTDYTYQVSAVDDSGNESDKVSLSVHTPKLSDSVEDIIDVGSGCFISTLPTVR